MISRDKSINKPSDFYKLKKEGHLIKSDNFQIRYLKTKGYFRVAFVVSKLVTPVSPKRNRLKRIFKSLLKESGLDSDYLIIIYPKITSLNKKHSELKVEFESVIAKLK